MSNKVGGLYNIIIDQVIKETKAELEESGDDPAVPEMLREAWKKRLKAMKVSREPLWNDIQQISTEMTPDILNSSVNGSMNGLNSLPLSADPLALYGLTNVKSLENNTGPLVQETQSSADNGNSTPSFIKHESNSIDDINKNSLTSSSGNYNPLESSKPIEKMSQQTEISLSPQLEAQLANAMSGTQPKVPQTDGPQDEELNSDLDDSEDELNSNDEEDDGDQTQIMLCLYEKVHKVKTRWKYTLKDGIANVNGLDYVFAKATGESEW